MEMDRRALLLVVVASATGCASESVRRFAVTLTESSEFECRGFTNSEAFEQETMDDIASQAAETAEKLKIANPPVPLGRLLYVNDHDGRTSAWFDAAFGDPFASAATVYLGSSHEGYIEGRYQEVANDDEASQEAGLAPCGDLVQVQGVLAVTNVAGLLGRIRWSDYAYTGAVTSKCEAGFVCEHDIAVEGLELE
jgi:hypothetical protein